MKKLWKRTLAVVLAVIMVIGAAPMGVIAAEIEQLEQFARLGQLEPIKAPQVKAQEKTGLFTYSLNRSGAFISSCDPSASGEVQIPAKLGGRFVYAVSSEAFANCTQISSVSLEPGAKNFSVLDGVLYNSNASEMVFYPPQKPDKSFTVPQSVRYVESYAFRNATHLEKVVLNNQLWSLYYGAFSGCTALTEIVLPDSLTSLSSNVFAGCTNLRSIVFPDRIDVRLYENCFKDTAFFKDQANWDNGVLYAANSLVAVQNSVSGTLRVKPGTKYVTLSQTCGITKLEIPASVQDIDVFSMPSTLRTVTVDAGNTQYTADANGVLYDKVQMKLLFCPGADTAKTFSVPNGVKEIGSNAFRNHTNLTTVNLPDSLETIGGSAFSGCTGLQSITLPDGLKTIQYSAFFGCTALKTIRFPDSLQSIGSSAFEETAFFQTSSNWTNDLLYSGKYLLAARKTISGSVQVREGTTVIAAGAFAACTKLQSVSIPQGVNVLSDSLFSNCTALQQVGIPSTVRTIESSCFQRCTALQQISLPEGVEMIGSSCFANTGLTEITFPASAEYFAYSILSGITSLQTVSFAEGTKTIPYSALNNCYAREVRIPSTVREIEDNAFSYMENLEKITVASGNTNFVTDSFGALYSKDMTRLYAIPLGGTSKKYTLPKTVTEAGYSLFRGYVSIEEFAFEEGTVESTYRSVRLDGNYSIHTVYIPASMTRIYSPSSLNGGGVTQFVVDAQNRSYQSIDGVLYSNNGREISAYPSAREATTFTIPKEVDYSSYDAFRYNTYLTTLIVEDGATSCPSLNGVPCLRELQIPASVSWINDIKNCPQLIKVTIDPNNRYCKTGEDGHIYSKDGSELIQCLPANVGSTFTLPASVRRIRDYAFVNCDKLQNVVLHDQLDAIGYSAFEYCTALERIVIPDSVGRIQSRTFYGCSALKTVEIGANVYWIDGSAFSGCTALEQIRISASNPYYSSDADGVLYNGDKTTLIQCPKNAALEHYTVASTVTEIGESAFASCKSLQSITLPDGLHIIGESAFEGCFALQSIRIPETVERIQSRAFYGCTALETIVLPQNGTVIGYDAFYNTAFHNDAANWDGALLYVQTYLLAAKQNGLPEHVTVRAGTKYIAERVFSRFLLIKSVSLPDGLVQIGEYAFGWCYGLTELTLPDSVTHIDNAFYGCSALRSVKLSANLQTMNYAFRQCTSLKNISIPASVTEMYSAFSSSSVETVVFADGMTEISSEAFRQCETLQTVTLPDSLTGIGEEAFSGCTSLQSMTFPDSLTGIGEMAFSGCTSLQSVTFPETLKTIGYSAFSGCNALTSVVLPDGLETIGGSAFANCEKLQEVLLGTTVQSVGYYAFENCGKLKSVVIPRSVTSIGSRAFGFLNYNVDEEYLIYCYPSTMGAKYAIDNGIRYEYIELLKPVLEMQAVSGGKAYVSGSFTNRDVKITVTNTEPKAGEVSFYYSTNAGKTWTPFDGVLELTTDTAQDYLFTAANADEAYCEVNPTLSVRLDKTAPTGEIEIGDGTWSEKWSGFVRTESVGHFTEKNVAVSVRGEDASGAVLNSGLQSVRYRQSSTPLSLSDLNSNYGWTTGSSFTLKNEGTYYIYARIEDKAGNVTILGGNDAQDGIMIDRTAPDLSVNYAANNKWTNNAQINGTATDQLSGVTSLTYTVNGGSAKTLSPENNAFSIPDSAFADGTFTVVITAKDRMGHTSEKTVVVKKDTLKPQISRVQYPSNDEWKRSAAVTVTASDAHSGISAYSFDSGKTWTDSSQKTYTEDVEIEEGSIRVRDYAGNICTYDTTIRLTKIDSEKPVLQSVVYTPVTKTTGAVTMTVSGTDAYSGIADTGYSFDGGKSWQAAKEKLYTKNTVLSGGTVMIRDKAGNTAAWNKTITIDNIVDYNLQVRVVDEVGKPVSGAAVYCGLGSASPVTALSDGDGYVRYMVTDGTYAIGALKDGYLPNILETTVKGSSVSEVTIVIGKQDLVEGTVDVHRMTLQEIIDAGIDVTDPENQYICEAKLRFVYQKREYTDTIYTFGGSGGGYSIGGGGFGGGGGGGSGGSGCGLWYYVIVPIGHPDQSFLAILDVPVRASILKEFFTINVQLINNASSAINISGNKLKLNVPDGLTVMKADGYQSTDTIEFDTFAGQETKSFSWILRGDTVGEYEISADYEGTVDLFNVTYRARFVSEEPLKVYGMEQVSLVARPDMTIRYRTWYLDLGIRNDSPIDINLPHIDIPGEAIHITELTGKEVKEFDRDIHLLRLRYENGYGFAQTVEKEPDTLAPGEAIFYEYVVYNAVDIDDEFVFRDACCTEMSGYQMNVVFEPRAMNHFSMLNVEEKYDALFNRNKEAFDYLTSDYHFGSACASRENEDNLIVSLVQSLDQSMWEAADLAFDLNTNVLTEDEQEAVVKETLLKMLQSDSYEDAVKLKVDRSYMNTVKKTLKAASEFLGQPDDLESLLKTDEKVYKLAEDLKGGGSSSFKERLTLLVGVNTVNQIWSSMDMDKAILGSLKDQCKLYTDIFDYLIEDVADARDAATLTVSTIMQLQAEKEQSMLLLSAIEDSLNTNSAVWLRAGVQGNGHIGNKKIEEIVLRVVRELKDAINREAPDCAEEFKREYFKAVTTTTIEETGKLMLKYIMKGTAYGVVSKAFKLVDAVTLKSDEFATKDALDIVTVIVNAINLSIHDNMNNDLDNKELNTMCMLKYLTVGRLLAEKYYHDLQIIYNKQQDGNSEKKKLIDEEYTNSIEMIQRARDQIFGDIAEDPEIPPKPTVTIDYSKMQTNESFDSRYEYNLNNGEWQTCTGGPIRFTLRSTKQLLHVRVKATDIAAAGKVAAVTLYSQNSLSKAITVNYEPGCYTISSLNDALTYEILFTDDANVDLQTLDWFAGVTVPSSGKQAKVFSYVPRGYAVIRSLRSDTLERVNSLPLLLKVNNAQNPSNVLVDESTGIAVRSDTDFADNVRLNIRVVSSGGSLSALQKAFPSASGYSLYDISLTDGKTTVDPQDDLTVMIPMGADAGEQKTLLYYLRNGRDLLPIAGKLLNNFLQFITGHFSLYAVVQFAPEDFVASQSVSVTPKETQVILEDSAQLSFAVLPDNATAKQVRWTTSDPSVVTVDETGRITAVGVGDAVVSAETADGGHTGTCSVTVVPNTYTVTWEMDGTQIQESVRAGSALTAPEVPPKEGHTFSGWTPAVPQTMPAEDQTFTAEYTKIIYTITWKAGEKTLYSRVAFGEGIRTPDDTGKVGYTFIGWTPEVPERMPASNLVITAEYSVNSYTVTWVVDGKTQSASVEYGSAIRKPDDPSKDGYEFAGWEPDVPETMPAEDVTFTAKFTPKVYDAVLTADGNQIAVIRYTTGQKSIELPDVPEKEGYTGTWPTYTLPIGGTTIAAVYSVNTYTVRWSVDGTVSSGTCVFGETIRKPADPTKEGYTFTGWSPEVPATMPAKDMTFTAQFTVNSYTVTWNVDGKTTAETVAFGDKLVQPADPVKVGWIFRGWTPTIPAVMPAKDLTFTAVFDKILITIKNYTKTRTVDYRASVTVYAAVTNPVSGGQIHWIVDGKDAGVGESFTVNEAKATYTVQAKYMKNGQTLAESEVETIKVNTGFFARLKAFFRALFGRLPKVVQEYLGIEIIDRVLP